MFSTISLFCLQNDRKHFVPVELAKSIPEIYCGAKVLLYHRESQSSKIFSLAMYVLKCFNKTHGEWLKEQQKCSLVQERIRNSNLEVPEKLSWKNEHIYLLLHKEKWGLHICKVKCKELSNKKNSPKITWVASYSALTITGLGTEVKWTSTQL